MNEDDKLLEHYMWGFTDELDSKPLPMFGDVKYYHYICIKILKIIIL